MAGKPPGQRTTQFAANGGIYLNVITAQTRLLSNQRTALNLQMEQMTAGVELINTLGGSRDVSHRRTAATP
jgi:outer membrane protein TolC